MGKRFLIIYSIVIVASVAGIIFVSLTGEKPVATTTPTVSPTTQPEEQATNDNLKRYNGPYFSLLIPESFAVNRNTIINEHRETPGVDRFGYQALNLESPCCIINVVRFAYRDLEISDVEENARTRFDGNIDSDNSSSDEFQNIIVDKRKSLRAYHAAYDREDNLRLGSTEVVVLGDAKYYYTIEMAWKTTEDNTGSAQQAFQTVLDSFRSVRDAEVEGPTPSITAKKDSSPIEPKYPHEYDIKRIGDLRMYQLALNLYSKDNSQLYPPLSSACSAIDAIKEHLVPTYMLDIPHDSLVYQGNPDYQIAVAPDRKTYVIRALLIDSDEAALNSDVDVDGKQLGCDCDDPNYCVTQANFDLP